MGGSCREPPSSFQRFYCDYIQEIGETAAGSAIPRRYPGPVILEGEWLRRLSTSTDAARSRVYAVSVNSEPATQIQTCITIGRLLVCATAISGLQDGADSVLCVVHI